MESATAQPVSADDFFVEPADYGRPGRPVWADFDWRPFLHTAEIGDRRVNYVRMGEAAAPPVVLIHGLAGRWQNWLENVQALAADFDVIALDLPGFGASDEPAEPISIPGYARTVTALMDTLGIDRAHFVGNSMGGQTAARAAIDFPERVDSLVLVSAAGHSTSKTPEFVGGGAGVLGKTLSRLMKHREFFARRPGLRRLALLGVAAHPERFRAEMAWELTGLGENAGFAAAANALIRHDFRDELDRITAPTLVIWGELDRLVGVGDAHRFARSIPGARKLILRETGHVAMIERPDWFNATVREFLLGA